MVEITKAESEAIRKALPNAHIVRTMKQRSKRHHYFCEEAPAVLQKLAEIRGKTADK